MENIITTMDLGSNSFRVLKFDTKNFESLEEYEQTVGTADGLSKTGNISLEALDRIIFAIKKSISLLDFNPKTTIAVTTQAMRLAKNNQFILEEIEKNTGVKFKIIEGKKEATLTLLAITYALKRENLKNDKFILLDIGGGSTELIISTKGKTKIKSFGFGIVTLKQSSNKIEDFKNFKKEVMEFIEDISLDEHIFVATAGTPTTIAALKNGLNYESYDKKIINGARLSLYDVELIQEKLLKLSKDELIKKVGKGREEFIDTGVEIFKLFYDLLDKNYATVLDDGLREGVAIDYAINFCS